MSKHDFPPKEFADRLARTRQAIGDALPVVLDVLLDVFTQSFAAGDDGIPAPVGPHGLGREVGVGPGTVPVTAHRLGVEGDGDAVVLIESGHQRDHVE